MDKKSALEIARTYAMLIQETLDVERVLLYGSYAKDTPNKNSDIDIAVIVKDIQGDYLAEQAKLFKLRRAIDLRIEPVLLLSNRDDSGFLAEIMATGEVIYSSTDL